MSLRNRSSDTIETTNFHSPLDTLLIPTIKISKISKSILPIARRIQRQIFPTTNKKNLKRIVYKYRFDRSIASDRDAEPSLGRVSVELTRKTVDLPERTRCSLNGDDRRLV